MFATRRLGTTSKGGQPVGVDDLLRRAAAAQRLAMERTLASVNITPAQFAVLEIVADSPGVSSADVARLERLTPPTMSVIVANLERNGAVARRLHPKNARIQCLEPTCLGLELREAARGLVRILRARIAAAVPNDAKSEVCGWLSLVAEIEV